MFSLICAWINGYVNSREAGDLRRHRAHHDVIVMRWWTYSGLYHIEAETKWPTFSRRHFQMYFLNENVWISIKISLKFVPIGPINNIPSLVQIMAWRRPGDKPLCEPMMVSLLTHICVTRPQCVKHPGHEDHSGYGLRQSEKTFRCNGVSHWLNPYPEWFLGTGTCTFYWQMGRILPPIRCTRSGWAF